MAAPTLLVLPDNSSEDARILTLAHPRTSKPCRYYFDPSQGIFEFTRIAAPKAACRSWLLKKQPSPKSQRPKNKENPAPTTKPDSQTPHDESASSIEDLQEDEPTPQDYITPTASLLLATPLDPLFLLLPSLLNRKHFLPTSDLLDSLSEPSPHFNLIARAPKTLKQIETRLQSICDSVDASDEKMYRLSETKLLAELLSKAGRMVASGSVPASMEEHFVKRALEAPMAVVRREESFASASVVETDAPLSEGTAAESVESQASTVTVDSISSVASAGTEITVPDDAEMDDSKSLHHLLRLRTALSYMLESYVPAALATSLMAMTASERSTVDFKPLEDRLAEIAKLKAEAVAARSVGDFSRKRNMYDEDDLVEGRLEKKKRIEEEEKKKKAAETRGIRDLKKVNTKGMKKMSDFFGKRTSPRKKA